MQHIARVDLSSGRISRELLPPDLVEAYLGGRGLGGAMLRREAPHADPLDSPLYAFVGPLTGTNFPLSNRLCFVFRSPATRTLAWAVTGGYAAVALKSAGLDGFVLTGRAPRPSVLVIADGNLTLVETPELWGRGAIETCTDLTARYGDVRVLSIGPAGEQGSPVATVINDKGRASGVRHGVGAVLGGKHIKAIVIHGRQRIVVKPNDDHAWKALCQRVGEKLRQSPVVSSKTGSMAVHGTPIAVEALGEWQSLPVRNYRETHIAGYEDVGGKSLTRRVLVERITCSFCPVRCRRETASSGRFQFKGEGPDYAQVSSLGTNCAVTDIEAVSYMNYLCYELGLDPVEMGNGLAVMAEATELGLLEPGLAFGDIDAMIELITETGVRRGRGGLLWHGASALARQLGAPGLAPAVKGITMQNCDPRPEPAWGLLNATETFGSAVHIWSYGPLVYGLRSVGVEPTVHPGSTPLEIAQAVKQRQDLVAVLDSLTACTFSSYACTAEDYAEGLRLCGRPIDADELLAKGEAVFESERRFNLDNGIGPEHDTLPKRFTHEPVPSGIHAGKVCDLQPLLREYYRLRDWSVAGMDRRSTVA
ncbi:MAG TPA: aldehyde ferredoxin oxidoreductase family protein [Burkholderiales bacterium]|nr:aldehyde ferredoxin oxidoreductase family protein [Burkholderiales bacterium]